MPSGSSSLSKRLTRGRIGPPTRSRIHQSSSFIKNFVGGQPILSGVSICRTLALNLAMTSRLKHQSEVSRTTPASSVLAPATAYGPPSLSPTHSVLLRDPFEEATQRESLPASAVQTSQPNRDPESQDSPNQKVHASTECPSFLVSDSLCPARGGQWDPSQKLNPSGVGTVTGTLAALETAQKDSDSAGMGAVMYWGLDMIL